MDLKPLADLIAQGKKEFFTKDYQDKATDEESLGIIIAQYFTWDTRIIKCFLEALTDANFHTEREKIEEITYKLLH